MDKPAEINTGYACANLLHNHVDKGGSQKRSARLFLIYIYFYFFFCFGGLQDRQSAGKPRCGSGACVLYSPCKGVQRAGQGLNGSDGCREPGAEEHAQEGKQWVQVRQAVLHDYQSVLHGFTLTFLFCCVRIKGHREPIAPTQQNSVLECVCSIWATFGSFYSIL